MNANETKNGVVTWQLRCLRKLALLGKLAAPVPVLITKDVLAFEVAMAHRKTGATLRTPTVARAARTVLRRIVELGLGKRVPGHGNDVLVGSPEKMAELAELWEGAVARGQAKVVTKHTAKMPRPRGPAPVKQSYVTQDELAALVREAVQAALTGQGQLVSGREG